MMFSVSKKARFFFLFVIALAGLLAYSNSLDVPFHFDDQPHIPENPHIRLESLSLDKLWDAATKSPGSRPLAHMSFALNYLFHGYNVVGYHIFNMAIHILSAVFFYFLLLRTLDFPTVGVKPENRFAVAGFAALIWLLHPIQTQSVTYIVQRMNVMAGMFYLLALWLYVEARITRIPWKRHVCTAGVLVSTALALGAKEIAITIPITIYLYEWFFFQDLDTAWPRKSLKYLAILLFGIMLVVLFYFKGSPLEMLASMYKQYDFTMWERVLTEARVIVFYITLLILPLPSRLNLDHDFCISGSLCDPITTLLALIVLLALIGTSIVIARRQRMAAFFIFWFLINLALESSAIGLELIYEHRLYLPSCSFAILVSSIAIPYLSKWRKGAFVVCLAVLFLYGSVTFARNEVWKDEVTLWTDVVSKNHYSQRGYYNLGNALMARGEVDAAIYQYKKAVATNPKYSEIYISLGAALTRKGYLDEATVAFEKALKMSPGNTLALANLGLVCARQGKLDDAVTYTSMAVQQDPELAQARVLLGYALLKKGKLEEAERAYSAAIKINPFDADSRVTLGSILLKLGRRDQAISQFREALRINPNHITARKQLNFAQRS